jgi:hypothetical protein
MGLETTAVSSVRKEYFVYLIYERIPSLPLPPFLPTAPRIPCREAFLTGWGWGACRSARLVSILLFSSGNWHGWAGGGEDA